MEDQLPATSQSIIPRTITGNSTMREIDRRQASSTIIKEEYLGQPPQDGQVHVIDVGPFVEERVTRVKKVEVKEKEVIVPRYEVEYVERQVEVPVIHYVDKIVEVPQVQEVVRYVTKPVVQEIPREVVRTVPRIEYVEVLKVVEVPGEIIEVPKPVIQEKLIPVPNYVDNEVPLVVAQTIRPVISEGHETVEVELLEYEPHIMVIDVHVPKPVPTQLVAAGLVEELHQVVTVPAAQYNSMLKVLNPHLPEDEQHSALPFIKEINGSISFLSDQDARLMYPAPVPTAQIQGYKPGTRYAEGFSMAHSYQPFRHPTTTKNSGAFTPHQPAGFAGMPTTTRMTAVGTTGMTTLGATINQPLSARMQHNMTGASRTYSVPPPTWTPNLQPPATTAFAG